MSSNFLGHGVLEIKEVNINSMTAGEAMWRVQMLKDMISLLSYKEDKPGALVEIANYALKGNKANLLNNNSFDLKIHNVDVDELSDKGLTQRIDDLKKRSERIMTVNGLLEIAKVAVTGVPF